MPETRRRYVDNGSLALQYWATPCPCATLRLSWSSQKASPCSTIGRPVRLNGDIEHAAALLHPKLGKAMRRGAGGGEAIIPSTAKVASAGSHIDEPLGNKDNAWSFDELDTVTVGLEDAPRPDEIVLIMAFSDGGRVDPRVGAGRAVVSRLDSTPRVKSGR